MLQRSKLYKIDTSFRLFEPIQITIERSLNGSNEVTLCYPIGAIVGNGILKGQIFTFYFIYALALK